METPIEKAIHLIFKIINKKYLPSKYITFYIENNEYPGISRIKIYGFKKQESLLKIYRLVDGQKQELSKDFYTIDENKGILILDKINIPLSEDAIFLLI